MEEKMTYDFAKIEKKWQKKWSDEKSFKAIDFHKTKPKYYVLYEFYNISGNLHMGHLKGTIPADALARYKRLKGYNVLFPIGGDAFGLPAENAAIKYEINPYDFVKENMNNAMQQSKILGLSFDWDRTICTSDSDYYKWTQWIFLHLFKKGKAYKEKGVVNFCTKCKTVLSNEDSQDGACDRCGTPVEQVERWVWFLKMQEYSEKLLSNVDKIKMDDNLKESQKNWVGKSIGVNIKFDVFSNGNKIDETQAFSTRPDTMFGITFFIIAPEHKFVEAIKSKIKNQKEVEGYQKKTNQKTNLERMENKEKTGVLLEGITVRHPFTNDDIPVFIADFALANYGTGCIFGTPAHDERDFEFAKKFNLPIKYVMERDTNEDAPFLKDGLHINSDFLNGLNKKEAIEKVIIKLEEKKLGEKKINYKMQDWSFNRQRFWGEPFPIIFCDDCGTVPVDEKDLPVKLPITDDYMPNEKGDSPLSKIEEWVNCKCPKCGKDARRETDTMPNWAGSSWYWLRYMDPHNSENLADIEKIKYWGPVDYYTGGTEHITRHVLYAFFWQNFLYEIGAVPTREPFVEKTGSGLVLDDTGKKMSKSSTNGVSPLTVIEEYGTDVARLHLHFLGGFKDNTPWTYKGINGIKSFLDKVWNLQSIIKGDDVSKKHIFLINKLIKKISSDIENAKLNTATAAFMGFIKKVKEDNYISKEELRIFLILLNPLAPHITSEIFEKTFGKNIVNEKWPVFNKKYLVDDEVTIVLQVNGKNRAEIIVAKDCDKKDLEKLALKNEKLQKFIAKNSIKRIIVISNKLVNMVV